MWHQHLHIQTLEAGMAALTQCSVDPPFQAVCAVSEVLLQGCVCPVRAQQLLSGCAFTSVCTLPAVAADTRAELTLDLVPPALLPKLHRMTEVMLDAKYAEALEGYVNSRDKAIEQVNGSFCLGARAGGGGDI